MASYKNFQSDNFKYTENRTDIYNPEFNNFVKTDDNKVGLFHGNLDKWIEFVSWARWYSDLWYDLITPPTGGIRLDLDQRVFLRCLARFISTYGVMPRGYGKCVSSDTLIYTDKGVKEIGEVFNYIKGNKEFYISKDTTLVNKYGELETSTKGVYSGYLPTKIITTQEGYQIEGTYNHPVLVMDTTGDLKYKNLEDIEVDDYVVINRKNDVWGNNTEIDIDMQKWLDTLSKNSVGGLNIRDMPSKIDEELALVLGYLIGDGTLTQENSITFSNKDKDIIDNFYSIFKDKFNSNNIKKKKGNNVDYTISDIFLRKYLYYLGLDYVNAFGKTVPKIILEAPKNIVAKFLQGLFDTDGGISGSYIEYCTASSKLSKQIQLLLLNFGIISTRRIKYSKKFKTYSYRIDIYSKNIELYNKYIGFSCKEKQKKLDNICQIKRNTNKELINLLNHNYFYSKVNEIENNINHVYDLSLPESNSFISNGFVSHNTLLGVMGMYHAAVFFPDIELSMSAQTKENGVSLLEEKHREITRLYPLMSNEISKARFSKDNAEIVFTSGGRVDVLVNQQSSKGARRKRLNIEESALLNNELFKDVLEPIVNVPRRTIGERGVINPEELNGSINFFSTSGFRGTDEWERNINMVKEMAELKGRMVLGSNWRLAVHYGRGETKAQILAKRDDPTTSITSFNQNYESKWTGAVDGALVSINKVMDLRTLHDPELMGDDKSEYIVAFDVARSESESNNQSSIVVLKLKRNKKGQIIKTQLVNLVNLQTGLTFFAQTVELKKIKLLYNAKMVVVDGNGLGKGIVDECIKETIDPITRENLGCWATVNTNIEPETKDAEPVLYVLVSQGINSDVTINFIDFIEGIKLELLEKKSINYNDNNNDNFNNLLPHIQTDFLLEEIANLKLKKLNSGKYTVEQVSKKTNKDRFSALAYGCWYIRNFEYDYIDNNNVSASDYLIIN